ncbi:hypothetical protein ILYODFUR_028708 [Ilyodon furcidens]|uniref:Uncharacterized protein n=1 Tax=Ilyodon furcidens TaxID=33524 RepID=A0ABV0UL60_9TELE
MSHPAGSSLDKTMPSQGIALQRQKCFASIHRNTGSDLQCSASLLLRRFSQISESCFSSEPAGRQQPAESICSFLAVSVIISNIHLCSSVAA